MELQLSGGGKSVSVSDAVFDRPFNQALVHQVVTAYLAGGRSGTKAQKNRGDVRGGGKKPWRQKGTGRARAGTIRSPIWAGGGVTFAATPRDFAQKVNRKMYRAGLRSIFSELARSGHLQLIEDVATAQRKTKALVQALSERGCQPDGVLVVKDLNDDLAYSARNLPHLSVVAVRSLNPAALVNARQVIVTEDARNAIEEWLG